MTDDIRLLERFATSGDEDAFRELIERHLDLVYSAALRRVNGDVPLAEDVAQTVFTDLARKARALPRDLVLSGWLYEATRFAAAKAIRGERRRQAREQEALTMQHFASESTPGWEQLCPVLDDAMDELNATDRNAILLRYFKNQDFQAVGLALGVSDAAAQRRVSRAVERLREFFAKRGIAVGASGLVTVISANAVQAAPVGLNAAIATTLVATTFTTSTLTKGILLMASTKSKVVITSIAVLLLAMAGTTVLLRDRSGFARHVPVSVSSQQESSPGQVTITASDMKRSPQDLTITAVDMKNAVTNGDKIEVPVEGGTISLRKPK
jgi:RNA polymerase sigma factor (sigma-70 family)